MAKSITGVDSAVSCYDSFLDQVTRRRGVMVWGLALFAGFASAGASAQQLYRCTTNGKTVISDRPCGDEPGAKGDITTPVLASTGNVTQNYKSPYGEWRVQTQSRLPNRGNRNRPRTPWSTRPSRSIRPAR